MDVLLRGRKKKYTTFGPELARGGQKNFGKATQVGLVAWSSAGTG
jgi:hypothetical protein